MSRAVSTANVKARKTASRAVSTAYVLARTSPSRVLSSAFQPLRDVCYVQAVSNVLVYQLARDRISRFLADTKDGQVPTTRAEARVAAHQTQKERGITHVLTSRFHHIHLMTSYSHSMHVLTSHSHNILVMTSHSHSIHVLTSHCHNTLTAYMYVYTALN